jgi:hypothetical protein
MNSLGFRGTGRGLLLALLFLGGAVAAFAARFDDATKARIDGSYAVVLLANGAKSMVPLASLPAAERAQLVALAAKSPLPHGKATVVVAKEVIPVKQTIMTAKVEGALETVQLCPPNAFRDQIGATCMLYGRVHWLDIAGYGIDIAAIHEVTNTGNADAPYKDPRYQVALRRLIEEQKPRPLIHPLPGYEEDPFEWARGELRKGRPLLAAFPKEIWQALPPGFVAQRPWSGGDIGHQVVVNGFTWNKETKQGTFHIVNSWNDLPEFDLKTEMAGSGAMIVQASMSPRGEAKAETVKETVKAITLIRTAGKTNLYEVETNLGKRRIAAVSETAARALVEDAQ